MQCNHRAKSAIGGRRSPARLENARAYPFLVRTPNRRCTGAIRENRCCICSARHGDSSYPPTEALAKVVCTCHQKEPGRHSSSGSGAPHVAQYLISLPGRERAILTSRQRPLLGLEQQQMTEKGVEEI